MQNCLLIYRAERFSPNAVERDKAMMDAVADKLMACGIKDIVFMHEDELCKDTVVKYSGYTVIHMTRSDKALSILEEMERRDSRILNSPKALRRCSRTGIEAAMETLGLPTPNSLLNEHPELGGRGWWEKSIDTTDSSDGHVRFSEDRPQVSECKIIQPHIEGKLLKFYGVRGTDFFHVREEMANDILLRLSRDADKLACALGLDIYGGDAVLTESGLLTIIDFNDFPSFSSCREQASAAIVEKFLLPLQTVEFNPKIEKSHAEK